MLDEDGSGSLEADELAEAFQAVGIKMPLREIQRMINEMETGSSGALDFEEFQVGSRNPDHAPSCCRPQRPLFLLPLRPRS